MWVGVIRTKGCTGCGHRFLFSFRIPILVWVKILRPLFAAAVLAHLWHLEQYVCASGTLDNRQGARFALRMMPAIPGRDCVGENGVHLTQMAAIKGKGVTQGIRQR